MKRRTFIKTTSLAYPGIFIHRGTRTKEDRIKLGIIGTGWWGRALLLSHALASGEFEVVALCDVNEKAIDLALDVVISAGRQKPKTYKDYRELYEHPQLDAVVIATPTHWHALQFIDACKKGLDVWLEKPISYDIREAQAMRKAHEKAQNMVTVDFPRLWSPFNTEIQSFIQSGKAGEIKDIQFQIHNPDGTAPVTDQPDSIDYDMFCGPAPKLPYQSWPDGVGPYWRGQHDFNRGILADWGIHFLENIRQVMDLETPNQIQALGAFSHPKAEHPINQEIMFDYSGLPVQWSHKGWGFKGTMPHTNIGILYNGAEATIFSGDMGWEVYSKDGVLIHEMGNAKIPNGHPDMMQAASLIFIEQFKVFADAIRSQDNQLMKAPFEIGFDATVTTIMADIAFRNNIDLEIRGFEISNHSESPSLLLRQYRAPYKHPYDHI